MDARALLDRAPTAGLTGSVIKTTGMMAVVAGLPAPIGATVRIEREHGEGVEGEVVGFRNHETMVSPFGSLAGVNRGASVRMTRGARSIPVGPGLLGRVVNAHGNTIDGRPRPEAGGRASVHQKPPTPMERPRIDRSLSTGIKAIDGLLTCGMGQRLGIFSAAGVGKSTLLGMMARYTQADVNVICLTGERGREVGEFLQRDLGPTGLARSVVVVATSDEPPLMRLQAVSAASAVAEHFRDQGKNVLLLVDSMTRVAQASREIGLAAGEPPTTRGFPPSTFSLLPQIVERAGRNAHGSITAFYTVLVEGDDPNEPIADAMRGLLDGHLWLSRKLAAKGHYPAVDVVQSISRLMLELTELEQQEAASHLRGLLAALEENDDLISIGAYRTGTNPRVDAALAMRSRIDGFLRQRIEESVEANETLASLLELGKEASQWLEKSASAAQPAASASGLGSLQPPITKQTAPAPEAPAPAA